MSVFENSSEVSKEIKKTFIKLIVAHGKVECLFHEGVGLQCDQKTPLSDKALTKEELNKKAEPLFEEIDTLSLELISKNNSLKEIAASALMLRCGGG